jgi:hypothetical protein
VYFNAQEWNSALESGARAAEQPEHQVPGHGPGWSRQYVKRNAAMCILMPRSGRRPRKAASESGALAAEQPEYQVPGHGPGWSHQSCNAHCRNVYFNAQEWNATSESGSRAAEQLEHQVPRHGPG